jgi:hypothetical protein
MIIRRRGLQDNQKCLVKTVPDGMCHRGSLSRTRGMEAAGYSGLNVARSLANN